MDKVQSYRDLIAWQRAYALAIEVYRTTKDMPRDEIFGLRMQSRRAAASVPSNIAEGWGRQSKADYVRFLRTARGSLFELETQLSLAADLDFIELNQEIQSLTAEVGRVLNGLINSLEKTQ